MDSNKRTLALTLNWNGEDDTVACIESIILAKSEWLDVLVFDNHSRIDSLNIVKTYLEKKSEALASSRITLEIGTHAIEEYKIGLGMSVFLYISEENIGFSKGCNLSVRIADALNYQYILMLNNDTTVTPGAIDNLLEKIIKKGADIVIPQIRYYSEPDIIWNCGGHVSRWGKVIYAHENRHHSSIGEHKIINVEHFTGCCFLTKTSDYLKWGGYTERFFFGEEDVEFTLRNRNNQLDIICVTDSIIYHKVGASTKQKNLRKVSRKAYVHYLNRMINMRLHLNRFEWYFWRELALMKCLISVKMKYRLSWTESINFIKSLRNESLRASGVSKVRFEELMSAGLRKVND